MARCKWALVVPDTQGLWGKSKVARVTAAPKAEPSGRVWS